MHFALWPYALRNTALLHNSLPVLKDGTSRLELFSSIRVGANMKHVHTFACPVFALQNALALESQLPQWSPRAHLGLNLVPSPIHARNVYLILNLTTGCVLPQYHCHFDDFFETTHHGGPDISSTICWQQLAGLTRAGQFLSDLMAPTHPSTVSHENLSTSLPNPSNVFSISQVDFGSMEEDRSVTSEAPHVGTSSVILQSSTRTPSNSRPSQVSEGDTAVNPNVNAGTSQRGRVCTMSRKMADSTAERNFYGTAGMHYMANQSLLTGKTPEDLFHDQHFELQERMRNPIAFHAKIMGDIMYFQQALQQPNAEHFIKAVIKEVNGHVDNDHWALVKQDTVPDDVQIAPFVWSMRRKCDLTTNEIKSHKARLNLHGGKQVYGMNYFETYALVVMWFAIRLMIVFGIIFCWFLCQVDFVMAYPQAPIKTDIYMELPQGVQVTTGNSKDHVLKFLKNIYGQKQAGRVWNSFLVDKLTSIGFQPSTIDDCVFFRGNVIFMVYVDNGVFIGDNDSQLTTAINKI